MVQRNYSVIQILYGQGLVIGTNVFDTISIGEPAITTPKQGLGLMDKVSDNFAKASCDGFYVSAC